MSDVLERRFGDLSVSIDRETCMANESCISIAPEIFELDNDRVCSFVGASGGVERERLIEACRICPVDALSVVDEHGNEIVP